VQGDPTMNTTEVLRHFIFMNYYYCILLFYKRHNVLILIEFSYFDIFIKYLRLSSLHRQSDLI